MSTRTNRGGCCAFGPHADHRCPERRRAMGPATDRRSLRADLLAAGCSYLRADLLAVLAQYDRPDIHAAIAAELAEAAR